MRAQRRSGGAGFTLVEILLAMTLLGVVTALVTGGLSFGTRVWDREQRQLAEWSDLQATQAVLRRLLSQAIPLRSAGGAGGAGLQISSFTGSESEIRFIGPPPARSVRGGVYQYQLLRRNQQDGSVTLVLTWRLRPPDAVRSRTGATAGNRTRGQGQAVDTGNGSAGGRFGRSRFGSSSRSQFDESSDSGLFSGSTFGRSGRGGSGSGSSGLGSSSGFGGGDGSGLGGRSGRGFGGRDRDRTEEDAEAAGTGSGTETTDADDEVDVNRLGDEVVLAKDLRAVRFTYFGKADEQDKARWRDRWRDSPSAPSLVRVEVEFPPNDRRRWPDLIIAPLLSTPSGQG